jgi:hypothetical protein
MAEARERWQECADAEDAQRRRILAAKHFRAGDQWPAEIKTQRSGGAVQGQAAQPAKPCLVVDRLSQPCRQVSNTIKNADFGFNVMPVGHGADDDTAEIIKGLLRRIHHQSRGESPVEWAADQAIEGGLGWFRLLVDYVYESWPGSPDDPEAYDQELRMARVANNLSVYCDPHAILPTRSDARFMFLTEDLSRSTFLEDYEGEPRSLDEFMATGDMKGWVDEKTVRIAEYWTVTFATTRITQPATTDGQTPFTRIVRTPTVQCWKINALGKLRRKGQTEDEAYTWLGPRIPVVPVFGEELNVDGAVVLRGIIEPGMDGQRMVNYTYSAAMETYALGSKAPYIAPAAAIANYKAMWGSANTTNWSYLPYDEWDETGRQLSRPARDTAEAPIQAAVELMRVSEDAIKASTSTGDASLGNTNPNERSGRALQALQAQSDLANSNYPDNVRRAIIYAAEQMLLILPKITRPGQILHTLGLDDEPEQVMIGKQFVRDSAGLPVAVGDPRAPLDQATLQQGVAQFYDLTKGRYAVTVSVGKATATRREEGAAALNELIPHLPPEMAAVAAPEFVEQLSFPGAHKIAEKMRKTLPPNLQDQQQDGQAPDPAALQAQIQAMQQQLQQAHQAIQTDQAKQQATIQKAHVDAEASQQQTAMQTQADLELQRIKSDQALEELRMKLEAETALALQKAELERETQLQVQQMKDANALEIARVSAEAKALAIKRVSLQRDAQGATTGAEITEG